MLIAWQAASRCAWRSGLAKGAGCGHGRMGLIRPRPDMSGRLTGALNACALAASLVTIARVCH